MTPQEAWKKLIEVYQPKPKPSEEMYQVFLRAMKRYSPLAVKDAYDHCTEHEKWFPTAALFADYCDIFQERIEDEEREKQKKAEKVTFEKCRGIRQGNR